LFHLHECWSLCTLLIHVVTVCSKCTTLRIQFFFLKQRSFWEYCGLNWDFWMTDLGKWHFKLQFIQNNNTLLIWVIFWDQKKWTITVGNSMQGNSRQGSLYLHIVIS
jgi:hypothetical protein